VNREAKRVDSSDVGYFKGEAKEILNWLSRHKWAATGILLITSTLYLCNFVYVEKIPLSITSPSVIAAIPVISVYVAILIFLFAVVLFVPLIIFFFPFRNEYGKNYFVIERRNDGAYQIKEWRIVLGWFLLPPIICPAVFIHDWGAFVFIAYIFAVVMTSFWLILLRNLALPPDCESRRASFWFWIAAGVAFVFQIVIMLVLSDFFIKFMEDAGDGRRLVHAQSAFCLYCAVLIQFIATQFLKNSWRQDGFLKKVTWTSLGVIVFLGAMPHSASFLTGFALQTTSSGARGCAVLSWAQTEIDVVEDLVDKANPSHSINLRILADVDGYYIVRRHEDYRRSEMVYFISRRIVAGMKTCPVSKGQSVSLSVL